MSYLPQSKPSFLRARFAKGIGYKCMIRLPRQYNVTGIGNGRINPLLADSQLLIGQRGSFFTVTMAYTSRRSVFLYSRKNFPAARAVCIPHNFSSSSCISPNLSFSVRINLLLNLCQNVREHGNAPLQDPLDVSNEDPVIGNRYMLICGAFLAVFHFPFVQHTTAAVDNQFVSG